MTGTKMLSDDEEPNLPEKYTKSQLVLWSKIKGKQMSAARDEMSILSDAHGLLRSSEQHQQGLSVFMKRCRRDIISGKKRPELVRIPNPALPKYLQDVERYNNDLMNHVEFQESCTLPSKSVIEDEKRRIEEEGQKSWDAGKILHHNPNLVDPSWKKEVEEKCIQQKQKETRERVAHVILGVLQQWQETQDRGAGADPVTPVPPPQASTLSKHNEDKVRNSTIGQDAADIRNSRKLLDTVLEDEDEDDVYVQISQTR